jgi:hypothetical protein
VEFLSPAGVLKGSVDWEKLGEPAFAKDPRIPAPVLSDGAPGDLSHLSEDEAAFVNYCRFVTDTKSFQDALPVKSWGQCVLYQVQVLAPLHIDMHVLPHFALRSAGHLGDMLLHVGEASYSRECTVLVTLPF